MNDEKSSSAYGLARRNAASAATSPASRRRGTWRCSLLRTLHTAATSRQTRVIPPVYLVAAASPTPTPAIT
jgi:hypothetical protein